MLFVAWLRFKLDPLVRGIFTKHIAAEKITFPTIALRTDDRRTDKMNYKVASLLKNIVNNRVASGEIG